MVTKDDLLVYHIQHDETLADLNEQEKAILEYAHKLNFYPGKITESDVDKLKKTGLDDRAILDIALVICLFNFMNRLADGLGVETDPGFLQKKERAEKRMKAKMVQEAS